MCIEGGPAGPSLASEPLVAGWRRRRAGGGQLPDCSSPSTDLAWAPPSPRSDPHVAKCSIVLLGLGEAPWCRGPHRLLRRSPATNPQALLPTNSKYSLSRSSTVSRALDGDSQPPLPTDGDGALFRKEGRNLLEVAAGGLGQRDHRCRLPQSLLGPQGSPYFCLSPTAPLPGRGRPGILRGGQHRSPLCP